MAFNFFKKRPEASGAAPVEAEARPKFDIDAALNNKKFVEFLDKYPDAADIEPSEESAEILQDRFEAFERMGGLSKAMKELYKGEIAEKIGVKLEAGQLAAVDAHLEKMAIEDPESIGKMVAEIERRENLQKRITAREAQLEKLKEAFGDEGEVAEMERNLELAAGTVGFFKARNSTLFGWMFRSKEESQARKVVTKDYGIKLKEIQAELDAIGSERSNIERADELLAQAEEDFKGNYKVLFEDIDVARELIEKAKEKAHADLKDLLASGSLKNLDKAIETYESLQEQEGPGFDQLTEGLDPDFEKNLDAAVHAKVAEEMQSAFDGLTNVSLDGMQKALQKFLDREVVGSDKGKEARAFVLDTIEKMYSGANSPKKILLWRLHIKLTSKKS